MKIHDVIKRPVVTEKSTIAREEANIATFAVDPKATKGDIRRAVEQLFNVEVVTVRTMQQPRKKRRMGRTIGQRAAWKKAIVELSEGQSIEFFEGV